MLNAIGKNKEDIFNLYLKRNMAEYVKSIQIENV